MKKKNNNKNNNFLKFPKNKKPIKPDDNFDWSKIIKMVFGWGAVVIAAVIVMQLFNAGTANFVEVPYNQYELLLNSDKISEAKITKSDINDYTFKAELKSEESITIGNKNIKVRNISVYIPEPILKDQEAIWKSKNIKYTFEKNSNEWLNILFGFLPWILIIAVWIIIMRRMQGQGGGTKGIFSFGKSKAKLISQSGIKVTFNDVAGTDEAKVELQEIIEFLKEPKKFQRLGGKIPKGVLLLGPPGTGKTLLARAVAGEAGCPFFSISGADFVEMFVGVGASRVRDLFEQGKKSAPCIIFIDEIDAVGRQRGAGIGGGHDEREQTLNQLLVEMDGFEQDSGVIIIAATNRPDVLDPALLRPGRFDRQVVVDRPDVKGREGILKVHTRNIPLSPQVDLEVLAKGTPGLSGADLANLVNEAALLAARKNKKKVEMADFEDSKDKVMMGMERKSLIISEEEKKTTAYHECGHVLVARMLPDTDPVHKVTIIPRGSSLGVTSYLPIDEKHTYSKSYLESVITYALGGRAAEKLIFNHYTTGAGNDIEKATGIARKMVCEWGMSQKLGPLNFGKKEEEIFLGREIQQHRDYSEKTAQYIDEEVRLIVTTAMVHAENILKDNIDILHRLSLQLLEREILDSKEIDAIINDEVLPPFVREDVKKEKSDKKVPKYVKKLMETRKTKEPSAKDDNN
ncbi:MAG: ATP-dependent zinc metalloprotease FtsH [Bacteroidetes bacterium]|nr:ATP-dependent zinc metalloprotease FtsH [Bacteroidota bacterium]